MALGIIILLGLVQFVAAAEEADARVKAALEELGYSYEIDSDNDFKLLFPTEGDRTQVCFINSGTQRMNITEIREIWAPVYKCTGLIPVEIANRLLESSYEKKIGSFDVLVSSDGATRIVRFCAKISADEKALHIDNIIKAVAFAADRMEKELTQQDSY